MPEIALAAVWYVVLLVSFVFHEAAHGLAAMKLGDPTAYEHGQVTLDPLPHIRREPFGMIVMPIISYLLAGWMIGWASTPYDPFWAQRHRRRAALMALAGPAANLILVITGASIIRLGILLGFFYAPPEITFTKVTAAVAPGLANSAAIVVSILFSLNIILLIFNLIPLPPLDGAAVLSLLLTERTAERYNMLMHQPGLKIIGLIVAWRVLDLLLDPIHALALNILYPGAGYH
jgi:Zn-dependent protease